MNKLIFLIIVLEFFLSSALAVQPAEKPGPLSEGSKGKLPIQSVEHGNRPKLRILIITMRFPFTESHYMMNRKLGELLVADTENVEKVFLLALNADSANQSFEEPPEFDGRFLVLTTTVRGQQWTTQPDCTRETQNDKKMSCWEENWKSFLPDPNNLVTIQLDFLLGHRVLISQLQELEFNVGIYEASPSEYSMAIFRAFPTIKKYVIAQNTALSIAHWKYLGYEKIVGAMPGKDLAQIGDHKFATENAIRENMDYFRDRNEQLYIKPLEECSKLMEKKIITAIENGTLRMGNFEDLVKHAHFTEWDVKHRIDLVFTDTQPFLDFPIVEQEIEGAKGDKTKKPVHFIGGITMPRGKVQNLNEDTKKIFASANGGVVLLSFGSFVEMHDDDAHAVAFKNIVVDMFKQYTQMSMIIKWGKRTSPTVTTEEYQKFAPNIYAKSWLEQLAILGSEPKLFITHGGQKSISEAARFGIPVILFPFFADQYSNAEALAARGAAKVLDIRSKTLDKDLTEAMNEIFDNYAMYKQKMEELSNKLNSIDPEREFVEEMRKLRKSL